MRVSSTHLRSIPLAWALFAPGCGDEPASSGAARPANNPPAANAANPADPSQPREIIGKRTQTVLRAEDELAKGARIASTNIPGSDPITMAGKGYVSSAARLNMLNVQHALDLYQASNGEYPKTYQEFMDEIIKPGKPDGIWLDQLPFYMEYGYLENERRLVVLEFPERKAQYEKRRDAELGR